MNNIMCSALYLYLCLEGNFLLIYMAIVNICRNAAFSSHHSLQGAAECSGCRRGHEVIPKAARGLEGALGRTVL